MGKIPYKIIRVSLAAALGLGAAISIYVVFVKTNAVHNTSPRLFISLAATITSLVGGSVAWLLKRNSSVGLWEYFILTGSLFLGYAAVAWQMLNSGYFFAFVMPTELALQALITWYCIPTTLFRKFLGPIIMTLFFIFGGYVSMNHELFGVRNEHYWCFLIFLYPHLNIIISLVGHKEGNHPQLPT